MIKYSLTGAFAGLTLGTGFGWWKQKKTQHKSSCSDHSDHSDQPDHTNKSATDLKISDTKSSSSFSSSSSSSKASGHSGQIQPSITTTPNVSFQQLVESCQVPSGQFPVPSNLYSTSNSCAAAAPDLLIDKKTNDIIFPQTLNLKHFPPMNKVIQNMWDYRLFFPQDLVYLIKQIDRLLGLKLLTDTKDWKPAFALRAIDYEFVIKHVCAKMLTVLPHNPQLVEDLGMLQDEITGIISHIQAKVTENIHTGHPHG